MTSILPIRVLLFRFPSQNLRLYRRRPCRRPTLSQQSIQSHQSIRPNFRNPIRRQAALNRNQTLSCFRLELASGLTMSIARPCCRSHLE
jgi:hypothetical protein